MIYAVRDCIKTDKEHPVYSFTSDAVKEEFSRCLVLIGRAWKPGSFVGSGCLTFNLKPEQTNTGSGAAAEYFIMLFLAGRYMV